MIGIASKCDYCNEVVPITFLTDECVSTDHRHRYTGPNDDPVGGWQPDCDLLTTRWCHKCYDGATTLREAPRD